MSRKTIFNLLLVLALIAAAAGTAAAVNYYLNLPERISQQETVVLGQNRFTPGSQAAFRVVVRDSKDTSPLAGAGVTASLIPTAGGPAVTVFSGATGASGSVDVSFKVPADAAPEQTLVVETRSALGTERVARLVKLERGYRVLLTTDKPLYQPGQVIHLRALALDAFDLAPAAGQSLTVTIADGKGNKVFRKELAASEFGAAAADFQLAGEVNTGAYKITAALGNTSSEKTVTVEHYVLPKFEVGLVTDRAYYQPGQHVNGSLTAAYFFGKPVAGSPVRLEGATFDVERSVVFTLEGITDDEGRWEFEFDLPTYLAGSDLDSGLARFYLQAAVTDQTNHSETSSLSLPVSASGLEIAAVPEGGVFRTGVENILYVITSYPDGSPAETDLTVNFAETGQAQSARSGPYGLAEFRVTPQNPYQTIVTVQARDERGAFASRDFAFDGDWAEETVLLRPEHPVYRVGDTMNLTLLASRPQGTMYVDIVREGQTVSTRSVELEGGRAGLAVDLTPDLFGTLELHAYKILSSGAIVRDTRLVVVDSAADLAVALTPGADEYKPGETAALDVTVTGAEGGVPAALGLAIVDESVFALAEQDPGFAKLYFLLEQEILQPRFDLHGFSIPELVSGVPEPEPGLGEAAEGAAQASLAAAAPRGASFSLQANSHDEAVQRARGMQEKFFKALSKGAYALLLAIPLALAGLVLAALWKEKHLGRSLLLVLATAAGLAALAMLAPYGQAWARSPLDRLGLFLNWISGSSEFVIGMLALAGLAGFIVLIAAALRRRSLPLGWMLALLVLYAGVIVLLASTGGYWSSGASDAVLLAGLIGFLLVPLAFLLRAAGFAWNRQGWAAAAALAVSVFLLAGALPVAVLGAGSASAPKEAFGGNFALQNGGMVMDAALPPMMALSAAMPTPSAAVERAEEGRDTASGTAAEPPRLRQYFPETMLWLPDAVTGEDGSLHLDIPVADSITTWRITALASSQDGRLGSAQGPLRVFQDFFIDLDLPAALTVGDEVSVPVGVFNYLEEAQTVRLELEPAAWFELLDEQSKELQVAPNEISVVYFRVKARDFGRQAFKVTAWGTRMSDAIQKEVRVYPEGKEILFSSSDRLTPGTPVTASVSIPAEAVPGTQRLSVKIYPGVVSQVIEGLESILRMPNGCFEQTSSTTYPNVLVMDYLKASGQSAPEVQMKAEEYINLGYQRLATFEVQGSGGFSLFGDAPADRMLTAYGLQEFSDMSRVHDVDPALIERAAEWLMQQQSADGSWVNDRGLVHENTWSSLGNDRLPVTAYIAWSLVDAGFGGDPRTGKGIQYVAEFQAQAEDPYALALVANALAAADLKDGGKLSPGTLSVLDRLAAMAQRDGSTAFWKSGVATFMGAEGQTGSIETTALAAFVFLRAGEQPDLANAALTYLIQQKDSFGTWHSTQATVLSLKALIQTLRSGAEKIDASVTVTLNDGQTRTVKVTPENFDVVQVVTFDDVNPGRENTVALDVTGEGSLMYQVSGAYYLPWDVLGKYPDAVPAEELVTIGVAYDRAELAVNDTVTVKVKVALNEPGGKAESALIDLGLPPGFTVEADDLAALVARYNDTPEDHAFAKIERYELTGRQILVYITNLQAGQPLEFSYRLRARFPLSAQTPASSAYDYYNPEVQGEALPQRLVVAESAE